MKQTLSFIAPQLLEFKVEGKSLPVNTQEVALPEEPRESLSGASHHLEVNRIVSPDTHSG